MNNGKLTRRKLAAVLISSGALAQTPAQTPSSADPMQTARDRIKAASEALAKEQIPMSTEPAFQFKV
jgi:hypothetical protein